VVWPADAVWWYGRRRWRDAPGGVAQKFLSVLCQQPDCSSKHFNSRDIRRIRDLSGTIDLHQVVYISDSMIVIQIPRTMSIGVFVLLVVAPETLLSPGFFFAAATPVMVVSLSALASLTQ
jgi:hypothetical protein